jgi:hypothetical protein
MDSKNPMIRLLMYGRIKKMMQGFNHKKLDHMEKNLMRGVFIKKMKDFEEQLAEESKQTTLLERLTGKKFENIRDVKT